MESIVGKRKIEISQDEPTEEQGLHHTRKRSEPTSNVKIGVQAFLIFLTGAVGGCFVGANYMVNPAPAPAPALLEKPAVSPSPAPASVLLEKPAVSPSPAPAPALLEKPAVSPSALKCGFMKYFDNHTEGPGIHKWRHYFDIYEENFGHYCTSAGTRPFRMMEIGIQSGGSIMMWRHAFGDNLKQLVGVDINPNTKTWEQFGPNVKVETGSQADPGFLANLSSTYSDGVDVILDDGSHLPSHIMLTFFKLWPLVRAGGVYMIQDIHGQSPVWDWIYFGYHDSQIKWPGIMGAESKKGPKHQNR